MEQVEKLLAQLAAQSDKTDLALASVAWSRRDRYVMWPQKALLFWNGLIRDNNCRHDHCYIYPSEQRAMLMSVGITDPDARNNGPAIMAFRATGGIRPKRSDIGWGWTVHHIYDGRFPAPGREHSLHAVVDPKHFTHTAGLAALHPVADGLAAEVPYFAWLLRAEAFHRFQYDPDGVFSAE